MKHHKMFQILYYMSLLLTAHTVYSSNDDGQTGLESIHLLPSVVVLDDHWNEPNKIQSIVMLDSTDLEDRQAEHIEDEADYYSGITSSNQTGGTETSLTIRGYTSNDTNVYVNGHKDNKRVFSRDLDTVEKVDIIKGHSSVVFGAGSPAGTIAYQTK